MKPQKKAQQREKEKGFEVFIQGANKERVNDKRKKDNKRNQPKMKKWKEDEQIGTLNHEDLDVLKKSMVQGNILSKSQHEMLKKLQQDTPIDTRYDPHFSQLEDDDTDSDKYAEEQGQFCQSDEEHDLDESFEEPQQVRESTQIPVQKVVELPATKPRPISALSTIEQHSQQHMQAQTANVFPKNENAKYASKPQLRANSVSKSKQEEEQSEKKTIQSAQPTQNANLLDDIFNRIEQLDDVQMQKLMQFLSKQSISIDMPKQTQSTYQQQPAQVTQSTQHQTIQQPIQQLKQPQQLQQPPTQQPPTQQPPTQPILQLPEKVMKVQQQAPKVKPEVNNLKLPDELQSKLGDKKEGREPTIRIDSSVQLKLRILSTWGNPSMVGLTEIELYQLDGSRVTLNPYNIKMLNAQSLKSPDILINGKAMTRDALNMWMGSMPDPPKTIEIDLSYDPEVQLGGIKVYNYNKSLIDSVKGVRDLEVIFKDLVKVVEIKKGNGFELDDYGTEIGLVEDFKFISMQETQSKFASKLRGAIDQSEVMENQEGRAISRKGGRGLMVYDVFNEVERPESAKQQMAPRRREPMAAVVGTEQQMEETLQYFNITNQGRFQPVQRNQIDREPVRVVEEVDALDMFFKGQSRPEPQRRKWDTNIVQPIQQQVEQQVDRRVVKQQQAMLVQEILNQPLSKPKKQVLLPTLPNVKQIRIYIHQTWGDRYYVGLNGIELFDENGDVIEVESGQISANPSDINVLPEYSNDPRTPDKLMDGTYLTQSDMHVWLSPFQKGRVNEITIELNGRRRVSMMRIWNYNKSRIHSFRGAKEVSIQLDGQLVFRGEIKKAPGNVSLDPSVNANEGPFELLIFTGEERVLQHIGKNDWINRQEIFVAQESGRPNTGNLDSEMRPTTSAKVSSLQNEVKQARIQQQQHIEQTQKQQKQLVTLAQGEGVTCRQVIIDILKPWTEQLYVGLTGIELYDKSNKKINIKNIKADPKDMNAIHGNQGDKRVLQNLIFTENITLKEENMWMIPFIPGRQHSITISFDQPQQISFMKVWNYNKSHDESFRGAQFIGIRTESAMVSKCTLLRRAPGIDNYDYGQVLTLPCREYSYNDIPAQLSKCIQQDYEVVNNPVGFELKLQLLNTHGDIHYIGLNGVEVIDYKGQVIQGVVGAEPSSIRELNAMKSDRRVVENLLDGFNETQDDSHMWLAPFMNRYFDNSSDPLINTVYFSSEQPFSLGCISIWNYTKTPTRGAHEIMLSLDDKIIYKGYLRQASKDGNQTVIMFSRSTMLMEKYSGKYYNELNIRQQAVFRNEEKGIKSGVSYAQLDRPITRVKGTG